MKKPTIYATTSMVIPFRYSISDVRRFVMVQERDTGTWNQPGGGLNLSDSDYLHACAREVREETGLTVVPVHFVGVYSFNSLHGNFINNLALATEEIEHGELRALRDSDIADVKPMTLEEIRELHSSGKLRSGRATLDVVEDYIRGIASGSLLSVRSVIHSCRI
ncbi:MAG: NUDIX domain-containing protein [Nanoarchaeota archaeon]|nr:NUDIX domain-containing protein [Nanoarchaeota archaeon]